MASGLDRYQSVGWVELLFVVKIGKHDSLSFYYFSAERWACRLFDRFFMVQSLLLM